MIRIADALLELRPGAEWSIDNNSYSQLDWLDTKQTKPTEEELVRKIAEIEYQEEVNEYQRQRSAEYPSYADQFDKIFHEGVDAWKADIQAIKDKYPKATIDADVLKEKQDKAVDNWTYNKQLRDYVNAVAILESDPDEETRAAAQAIIDSTPNSIVDSINN